MVKTIDVSGLTPARINDELRALSASAERVVLTNPRGIHNLAINLRGELVVEVRGSTGFYTGGFMNGPTILIDGNVGWYTADNMMGGTIVAARNSGSNLAPSMIGGLVLVRGNAGSRIAYGLKGGTVVVVGSVGMMAGKMMLGGRVVILGDAGEQLGESMYGGRILVGGRIAGLGANVDQAPVDGADVDFLTPLLSRWGIVTDVSRFVAVVPHPGKHRYVLFEPRHKAAGVGQ